MLNKTKYGAFNNNNKEFIINTPKTPRAWENYLYSNDGMFHAIISQKGEGTLFFDCLEVNVASNGRNYCIFDEDKRTSWSINGGEAPQKADAFQCIHRPGMSEFTSSFANITGKLEVVIALNHYIEIDRVTLTNNSDKPKKLSLIGYHLVNLRGLDNRLECQQTRFAAADNLLFTERRHYRTPKYNYAAFFKSDVAVDSFCGSWAEFLGADVTFAESQALTTGKLNMVKAHGTEPILALQKGIELAPSQSIVINFAFGIAQDLDECQVKSAFLKSANDYAKIIDETQNFFSQLIDNSKIETPDEIINTALNIYAKIQLHRQTISARSTGWYNWRNHLQDGWAYLPFDNQCLRKWIIKTCEAAKSDGFLPRCSARVPQLAFPDQTHADIGTWMALCASKYFLETADLEFFSEKLVNNYTVIENILRGIDWLYSHAGQHGLALMRDGDWSDPLEEVGKRDIGESPWTSMILVKATRELLPLLRALNLNDDAEKFENAAKKMAEAVEKHCWDGNWYIRAITDDGERLCCQNDSDGRISLLVQAWAIISGIASSERVEKLVESVENNCLTDFGPTLYAPPFLTPRPWIGRETAKPAGTCVNGAVYSHVAMMWSMANALLKRPEEAIRIIKQILPMRGEDVSDLTKAIPLWTPSYYHSSYSQTPGQASNVMTSAAPPWMFIIVLDLILGVRARVDGLEINPSLPADWDFANLVRHYRGNIYNIKIRRNKAVKTVQIKLNNQAVNGTILPLSHTQNQTFDVEVFIP